LLPTTLERVAGVARALELLVDDVTDAARDDVIDLGGVAGADAGVPEAAEGVTLEDASPLRR
jgi:hypothetical protein